MVRRGHGVLVADERLRKRLGAIQKQIDLLKVAEEVFLNLDASKKSQYAVLYLQTKGTVAEREALVYRSDDWKEFSTGLVQAEVAYNSERRRLDLQMKAFDAEYLTYKIENGAINRQGAIT